MIDRFHQKTGLGRKGLELVVASRREPAQQGERSSSLPSIRLFHVPSRGQLQFQEPIDTVWDGRPTCRFLFVMLTFQVLTGTLPFAVAADAPFHHEVGSPCRASPQ